MRVFKSRRVDRWAKKEGLADQAIREAAKEVAAGNAEANLGQYLFKKRIARPGKGKSSGFRTIVAFKSASSDKVFFVYGFAKSSKSNINSTEIDVLGVIAKHLVGATDNELDMLVEDGGLVEILEVNYNE
ncbi:MAG: hypothetical protein FD177_2364 [Desulfovibrionaceae bacterium]|nr:MAG: hypothetical protein FD177_2364 [Desulfovibrionaceae bacterium]